MNIFDIYVESRIISVHIGKNKDSTIECMNVIREENNDINIGFENLSSLNSYLSNDLISCNRVDTIYYEQNENENNNIEIIQFIIVILKIQKNNGSCILKLNNSFSEFIIHFLYLLSSLYEKVYIIKPNTSKVTNYEKYIVCKHFILDYGKINIYNDKIINFIETMPDKKHLFVLG